MPKIITYGDALTNGTYTQHSDFKKVTNFTYEQNLLIVSDNINYLSPNSIILSNINIPEIKTIKIESDKIIIKNKAIFLPKSAEYNSKFDYTLITSSKTEEFLWQIQEKYLPLFPLKSIAFVLDKNRQTHFKSAFEQQFFKMISLAVADILDNKITSGIAKLKGTGTGLTPSGDDFIAGVLFGLHINEHLYHCDLTDLKNEILTVSETKNLFSANFIKSAHKGLYFYRLKQYLTKAYTHPADTKQELENLFSIGNTSGADLLTGLIITLKHKLGI